MRASYDATMDWNGQTFMLDLVKKAGLMAIARGTGCTGGPADVEDNLKNLLSYGFDGAIEF